MNDPYKPEYIKGWLHDETVRRDLEKLAPQIEQASEGSREMSDRALKALGWTHTEHGQEQWWSGPGGTGIFADEARPDPIRSIDDAMGMLRNGDVIQLLATVGGGDAGIALYRGGRCVSRGEVLEGKDAIPRAITAAVLRAREGER